MKVSQEHRTAFLLVKLSIVIALLFITIEVGWPRAQTSAAGPIVSSNAWSASTAEEGSATLLPANLHIWTHFKQWYAEAFPCASRPAYGNFGKPPEDINGTIVAGFKHQYDKGLGCPNGDNTVYRGTVWFDLSSIISKAPPLHVSIQSATLHFRQSGECRGELLVATADWLKGYARNTLVPGDPNPLATLPSGIRSSPLSGVTSTLAKPCGDCSMDVETVVNNWVRGEEHGGYANYGFVFKGMQEADLEYENADSCVARYGDFSLTVKYKYDKEPLILIPLPKKPDIAVGRPGVSSPAGEGLALARTNVALAANGGVATASSTTPDTEIPGSEFHPGAANDGNRSGNTSPKNGFWRDGTDNVWPDSLQIDFAGSKKINEIDVFSVQDNIDSGPSDPTDESLTFSLYGITDFDVQYWNGSSWVTVPGGSVSGNNKVWHKFTFPAITTSKIRVFVNNALSKRSRIVELEAWTP